MATNGMTINSLNPLSALTADDKIPVWDTGASGEPTKEITAQNMANSVKSLASLPNTTEMNTAIAQSTATATTNITASLTGLGGNICEARFGKVVVISADIVLTATIPANSTLATVANRPRAINSVANACGVLINWSNGTTYPINVSSVDGRVKNNTALPSSGYFGIVCTYICA